MESIHFYGRRSGTANWQQLGEFTAAPFRASVPLAADHPESWEFQARAVHRDVEFSQPSAI